MPEMIDVTLPEAAREGTESQVGSWFKKPGEAVALHEPLLEIVTDKVVVEVPSPVDGVLTEILKGADESIEPSDVLGRIEAGATASPARAATAVAPTASSNGGATAATASLGDTRRLSPAVRRLLKQHNIEPHHITGSGRGGRLTASDVEAFVKQGASGASAPAPAVATAPAPADVAAVRAASQPAGQAGPPRVLRSEPITPIRRGIADHMVRSALQTAPHVTAVHSCDLTAVMRHRNAHKSGWTAQGVKVTLTAYFVAATVKALQAVPQVNSRWMDKTVELYSDCNIGIAAAVKNGLVVPVLREAQTMNLVGIAARLADITDRARTGRLSVSDMQHGTFTISNHGGGGSLIATPIINQPQSAILGIGKLEKRVVAIEVDGIDTIQIRPMMYVTVGVDHRVIDGFVANQFLAAWTDTIENWPAE